MRHLPFRRSAFPGGLFSIGALFYGKKMPCATNCAGQFSNFLSNFFIQLIFQLLKNIFLGLIGGFPYFRDAGYGYILFLVDIDQFYAGGNASEFGDSFAGHSDNRTLGRNQHDLIVLVYRLHSDHVSGLFHDLIAFHTFTAAVLAVKLIHSGQLAHTEFGYDQQIFALGIQLHSYHPWKRARSDVHLSHQSGYTVHIWSPE